MYSMHPLDAQDEWVPGAMLVIETLHHQLSALSGELFADTSNSGGSPTD
jgi:hypothetical protein